MSDPLAPVFAPVAAVSIAVFRGEEILIIQRGKLPLRGLWSLPGGHIEPGETAAAAALRELAEETGIVAEIQGVADSVDVIRHAPDGKLEHHFVIVVFAARWLAGEPVAASDCIAARFLLPDALPALPCTDGLDTVIERARRLHRGSLPQCNNHVKPPP